MIGTHWVSDPDIFEEDEAHTVTVDLISDFIDEDVQIARYIITYHHDDDPRQYYSSPWNVFMARYLQYV